MQWKKILTSIIITIRLIFYDLDKIQWQLLFFILLFLIEFVIIQYINTRVVTRYIAHNEKDS